MSAVAVAVAATPTRKQRTITLTDRRPVRIYVDAWPVLAGGYGDSWGGGGDEALHSQALARGELDTYLLRVRQHADGRTLVYGVFGAAQAWTGSEEIKGGELLGSGADIPAAIQRVGAYCLLPDSVIRRCIAALPAEDL